MIEKIKEAKVEVSNIKRFAGIYRARIKTSHYNCVPIVYGIIDTGSEGFEEKDIVPFYVPRNASVQEIREAIFDELSTRPDKISDEDLDD